MKHKTLISAKCRIFLTGHRHLQDYFSLRSKVGLLAAGVGQIDSRSWASRFWFSEGIEILQLCCLNTTTVLSKIMKYLRQQTAIFYFATHFWSYVWSRTSEAAFGWSRMADWAPKCSSCWTYQHAIKILHLRRLRLYDVQWWASASWQRSTSKVRLLNIQLEGVR